MFTIFLNTTLYTLTLYKKYSLELVDVISRFVNTELVIAPLCA